MLKLIKCYNDQVVIGASGRHKQTATALVLIALSIFIWKTSSSPD